MEIHWLICNYDLNRSLYLRKTILNIRNMMLPQNSVRRTEEKHYFCPYKIQPVVSSWENVGFFPLKIFVLGASNVLYQSWFVWGNRWKLIKCLYNSSFHIGSNSDNKNETNKKKNPNVCQLTKYYQIDLKGHMIWFADTVIFAKKNLNCVRALYNVSFQSVW